MKEPALTKLDGKTVLITGATSGIGLEAAVALAKMGARVGITGRDRARTERAAADIRGRSGSQKIDVFLAEFASQSEVRRLADEVRGRYDRLDVLVNNAGGVSAARPLSPDGIESTFAVNHLAPFLLTNLLVDLLERSRARIVNVASVAQKRGKLHWDDLELSKGYFVMKAYGQSKLANVVFTKELSRRLAGTGVTANCLHPGVVATNIWSKAPWYVRPLLKAYAAVAMISPEAGARPIVHLAASPEVEGRSGLFIHEDLREHRVNPVAEDPAVGARLWELSARYVKLD